MSNGLHASYAHCQQIARRSASSFYYSFLLLPKPKRRAMCALYAFLRRTDDLGDCSESVERRREALAGWRRSLRRSMHGEYDDPMLPALADTIRGCGVPLVHLEDVIDGVEMDLQATSYESFDDLEQYCHRVASAVGLACLPIWGCTSDLAEGPARHCGLAFQLTNILRDLKEDANRDRVYLPAEDLRRFDYSVEDLRAGVRDERFVALMRFEIDRAESFYAASAELDSYLTEDGRRVFGSMVSVYRALLDEIKRLDGDVLSRRVELTSWQKMRIASQWFLKRSNCEPPVAAGAR